MTALFVPSEWQFLEQTERASSEQHYSAAQTPKGHFVSDKWNLRSSWELSSFSQLQNLGYGLLTFRHFKKAETALGSLLRILCFADTYKPDKANQTNSVRLYQTPVSLRLPSLQSSWLSITQQVMAFPPCKHLASLPFRLSNPGFNLLRLKRNQGGG